jgi:HSP90 family molecular chaperone
MMLENNGDSVAAALAVSVPVTAPLWKTPRSVADTQSPIKLEMVTDFDSGFIPYEIEYGVVMDQLSRIYKSWKSTIREYIANAESACMSMLKIDPNYVPEIRVEYNPEQCLLMIEDNGIGLSKKMFMEVFRYFGRSRNAFDPTVSGMFGLGAKSFVMLVGDKGSMVIHTKSRETGECYKMYARKVGFDVLPQEDRSYGTSFTFIHDSSFNKLDVVKAIGEFSRYVRIP